MDKVSDGLLQRLRYIADTDDARFSGIDQTLNEAADELAAAQAGRDKALVALNSIKEYWNENINDRAMFDACWFAKNTAEEVLKECWKPKVEK